MIDTDSTEKISETVFKTLNTSNIMENFEALTLLQKYRQRPNFDDIKCALRSLAQSSQNKDQEDRVDWLLQEIDRF